MLNLPSPAELAILIPVFLLALTVHEYAHAWVAHRLGDPTARLEGRLTLNPLAHLDPIGSLAILLIGFGWARPVPVDGRYFKNPRRDLMLVALAGPAINLVMAAGMAFLFMTVPWRAAGPEWHWLVVPVRQMLWVGVAVNVLLAVFNLLPVPPLDGSRILSGLLPLRQALAYSRLEPYGFLIIFLLFFTGVMRPVYGVAVQTIAGALFGIWG
ncbi:MAG: site-2 protease family protein [Candidatus Methylomirabilales bacterium]